MAETPTTDEPQLPVRTFACRQVGCYNRDLPITMPCAAVVICCCGHPITDFYS